ncbi:MAG: 2-oxo acid dehydrogenase subunit E2 [Clostridia bacterium]|nr:2-oxo acid dehydrogenase subunit E2 [Clostridia bacterium]
MSKVVPASKIRKLIAKNMVNSWSTSPKCDFFTKVKVEQLLEFRKTFNEKNNVKVSFLNFVMKATAQALQEFPYVNASYDFENHNHILHEDINVGFALVVGDDLIVVNTKNTEKVNLIDLNKETNRLIEGSKTKKLTMDDITGGTITINNMGIYKDLEYHTAIINQPEMSILSIYTIKEEPVIENGEIKIGQIMNMALSADHRVIDGKLACEFLFRVKELIENPDTISNL